MNTKKVVALAESKGGTGAMWTPKQVLERAISEVDESKPVLVAVLDDAEGRFDVFWLQSGLTAPQIIALARVMETKALKSMGY